MFKNKLNKNIVFLIIFLLFTPIFVYGVDIVVNDNISISAIVSSNIAPPGGGGGGGGGGGVNPPQTVVNFSGMAYPLSRVFILQDGVIVVNTISDPGANFSVSVTNLSTGNYTFSVYGEDAKGRKSQSFSFPLYITSGTTVNIGNIYLSPTIDIDKSEVKKGDNLAIFGQSVPSSDITISVHSDPEYFFKIKSNTNGVYLYNLDTAILELGKHQTKSKSAIDTRVSSFTSPLSFLVGNETKVKEEVLCSTLRGDLNCDNHVNLVDFSIMAFWYKKTNIPAKVDLNNDTKVTLVDFSIMAYNWTG